MRQFKKHEMTCQLKTLHVFHIVPYSLSVCAVSHLGLTSNIVQNRNKLQLCVKCSRKHFRIDFLFFLLLLLDFKLDSLHLIADSCQKEKHFELAQ